MCAGTIVVVTRFAVGEIDPVTLAFYRYAIAMICLLPVLPFVWPKARVPAADVITIALLGAAFFGFFPWAFSAALQYTTAARGAIGIATIPIQTLIVAAIFGREKLTRSKLLSVALGFAGIAIVFGPEAYRGEVSRHWLGDGLMLMGGLSAAIYSVFGRPMFGKHGAMLVMVLAVVFGLLTLTLLAAASGILTDRGENLALCNGHLPTKTFPINERGEFDELPIDLEVRVALGRKPIDQVAPSPVLLDALEVLL